MMYFYLLASPSSTQCAPIRFLVRYQTSHCTHALCQASWWAVCCLLDASLSSSSSSSTVSGKLVETPCPCLYRSGHCVSHLYPALLHPQQNLVSQSRHLVLVCVPPRWPSGKASASRAEDPGFKSRLRRDFFRVESYQWLKNWHSSGYPARRLAL